MLNKIIKNIFKDMLYFKVWFKNWYSKSDFKNDFLAWLTWSMIVIPQSISFALIAWLPVEYWLFTAIFPVVISAFFWWSLILVSWPTTALSTLTISSIQNFEKVWTPEYLSMVILLTALVWIIQIFIWLIKAWKLLDYIWIPVILWFTYWSAIIIILWQLKNLLWIDIHLTWNSVIDLYSIFLKTKNFNLDAWIIWILTIIIALISKKFLSFIPNYFVALFLWSVIWNLLFPASIIFVSWIETWFPNILIPSFDIKNILNLLPYAFIIASLWLLSSISLWKQMASKTNSKFNTNQECLWQWLWNFFWSFLNSYISSWSVTRTIINYESWAKTPISSILSWVILFLILIISYKIFNFLAIPSLAWITILAWISLINVKKIKENLTKNSEKIIFIVTFLSAILIKLEYSIIFWILFQFIFFKIKNDNSANKSL